MSENRIPRKHLTRATGSRSWFVRGAIISLLLAVPVLLFFARAQPVLAYSIGTYDQCSNDDGDGYSSGDTGCRWINGNLQSNNSTYVEGDATVQRLWLTDFVPGSSHTITFKYGTTKGGKHAYDFLTTWDWSEDWITVADRCQDITGCVAAATESTINIPVDPNAGGFDTGTRQFVMRGGSFTAITTPTITSGSYAGDSETIITVTFTVGPSSGDMCETKQGVTTCGIALWFGAHVAAQANWGTGNGAGSISGSPYHVALDAIDGGAIGQRDNQMQAGVVTAIPNGTITIIKDVIITDPDPQDFDFVLTNNSTITENFSLDDDNDGTLPSQQSFSVPPGTWTATETVPAAWTLQDITCVDPTGNTTTNLGTATATINLASNETVTCTFTNRLTPTAFRLDSFKGVARAKNIKLKWRTANEFDVVGFNLLRSTSRKGTYAPVNTQLLPAENSGQTTGTRYVFKDSTALSGQKYFYQLQIMGETSELERSDLIKVRKPPAP
jgi:hypothetical protein